MELIIGILILAGIAYFVYNKYASPALKAEIEEDVKKAEAAAEVVVRKTVAKAKTAADLNKDGKLDIEDAKVAVAKVKKVAAKAKETAVAVEKTVAAKVTKTKKTKV